jgi:teichuronic acid exporter
MGAKAIGRQARAALSCRTPSGSNLHLLQFRNAMTVGQSIRNGVKWLAFGKVGNRLFEFAFGVALARMLVPADFGMIATIHIFTGFVGMFTAGGMGQSLIRAKHADVNDFTAVFTLQLAVGVLVYLAFFLSAPLVARFFENPVYTDLVRISALSFLLRPLVSMRNAWLNREMQFKSRTIVDISTAFVGGFLSVSMALFGMGVWSLTISGLLGALFNNLWLARLTPLRPRLNFDVARMRKHAGYGSRIVGNDFVNYLHAQSRTLILSKMAGPAFLGLFNKAESLARLPNQLLMSPTMEPLFRAMSKAQDDLDQTKYLFHRAVTLLMAYTTPAYVLLWWIAEPFIGVVYGPNWSAAGAPMSILTMIGIFLNVAFPCSAVLAAQNRLGKEMLAAAINLPVLAGACVIGLRWGLEGVAWGVVLAQIVFTAQLYLLVLRTLPTRIGELVQAVSPGLLLGALLFGFLALVDQVMGSHLSTAPGTYALVMSTLALLFYASTFLLLPLRALESEAARWRTLAAGALPFLRRRR